MGLLILTLISILVAVGAAPIQLEVYQVGDATLKQLYCEMTKLTFRTNDEALKSLEVESAKLPESNHAFNSAKKAKINCPKFLLETECIAVRMYTTKLYKEFNQEMRNGRLQSYKILASLIHSAVVKLSKMLSTTGVTVYRGMSVSFVNPKGPFYFKQFTSTSSRVGAAKAFSKIKKLMKFEMAPNALIAKISSVSLFPSEEELLISPFQALQYVNEDDKFINFRSVDEQIKCP